MYKKIILLLAVFAAIETASAQKSRPAKDTARISSDIELIDGKVYVPVEGTKIYGDFFSQNNKWDKSKLKEKEVSIELNTDNARMLVMDNEGKNLEIKTWSQPKIKVSTTILIDESSAVSSTLTDKRWFEKLNTSLVQAGSNVRLRLRGGSGVFVTYMSATAIIGQSGYSPTDEVPVSVYDGQGNVLGSTTGKALYTVYVPASMKLELDNRYGNITASGKLAEVDLTTNGGMIDLDDVDHLKLRSTGTNFTTGNIREAEIELSDGRFSAANIEKLDIDTKGSTIEINSVNDGTIRSSNDQYDIEEVGDIRGRKTYGNIRITTLKKSLDLEGANADIRVRNIDPAVELIKLDNKYADIRLPMRAVKNFTVDFKGGYNTVYASFEKKFAPVEKEDATRVREEKAAAVSVENFRLSGNAALLSNELIIAEQGAQKGFTASGGDTKGKYTKFIISCSSCTVDFK
jgi:hypothetical protein